MAVFWLAPLCTVTITVSRNGLISGNFFSLTRVPQIPFGVTLNWSLKNVSLIPRSVILKNCLQRTRRLFTSCQNVDLNRLEVSHLNSVFRSKIPSRVLSQVFCLYGRYAVVLLIEKKCLMHLWLFQTD